MSALATLLDIVVPVFLVVGAGYAAVRTGYLPANVADALVTYTTSAAVPCLFFVSMTKVDLGMAVDWRAAAAFFAASTAGFAAAMALSRIVWHRRPGQSVSVGFSSMFSNVVMLGIPITERAFGPEVVAAVFGIIAFHSPYNFLFGFTAMEIVRRDGQSVWIALGRAFSTAFRNPLMVGLLLGIGWNLSGLPVPSLAGDALEMLAATALPAALFSLGGILTRYRLRDEIGEACMVSTISLLVHPGLAWLLTAHVFGLAPEYVRAAVVLAAMPAGINGYIFASLYDRAVGTAANTVLLSTILSVGTITFWLAVVG